jgi:hypothetical protein
MNYFNLRNPSDHTRPWEFTQPLTEMSSRNRRIMFLRSRARPVPRAYCLDNAGSLASHNPTGLHGLLRDSFTLTVSEHNKTRSNILRVVVHKTTFVL